MSLAEDIHSSLLDIFHQFDSICKEKACLYNIVCDEPHIQGYVVHDKKMASKVYDYLEPVLRDKQVHCEIDRNRTDGVLFTFTLGAIRDGHWKVLPSNPKSTDFSPFANADDAKKVKKKKTIYQTQFGKKLDNVLEDIFGEDQYKSPTGKHRRSQSAHPSSYRKSRTFGGVSESFTTGPSLSTNAQTGTTPLPVVEPPSSLGMVSADRTADATGSKDFEAYPERMDATDNPTTVDFDKVFSQELSNKLAATDVVPSDTASVQAMDPTGGMQDPGMAQQQITAPLGTASPSPKTATGPNVSASRSNARSSDLNNQYKDPVVSATGPEMFHYNLKKELGQLAPGEVAPTVNLNECKGNLPEDGYDFMQQLNRELGLGGDVRKYTMPNKTDMVSVGNGEYRLELENNLKLTVYRRGKKKKDFEVDLGKNTIVDELCTMILKVME